jgi:hypothetical protein
MLEKEWLENLAEEVEELRQSLGDVDLGTLVSDPRFSLTPRFRPPGLSSTPVKGRNSRRFATQCSIPSVLKRLTRIPRRSS